MSTHKKPWVYATKRIATCMMFIGRSYDVICQPGVDGDGKPNIFERFEGALEYGFGGQSGSIYLLDGSSFKEGMTQWSAEVVSVEPVEVIGEIKIEDLYELEKQGEITIYRYPNTPNGVMKDKEDLIVKVTEWISGPESQVWKDIQRFHPDIADEVARRVEKKGVQLF
jgi:hypothetical protein